MLTTLGNYAIHLTAVGALMFLLIYGFLAPWWKSSIGRNLMVTTFSLLLIFGLSSITIAFGTQWPARPWIRLVVVCVACAATWWRVIILLRFQLKGRIKRVDEIR